jgi:hypothetical protein
MTKNCWRSVDAHSPDGAGNVSLSVLPIKEANTLFITICNLSLHRKPKIHDHESLTPHRRSFSWWGGECFTVSCAYKGRENCVYDYIQPIAPKITQDTWPEIMDAPLTLILPRVYPQYAIIWFRVVHHSRWVGSLLSIFSYSPSWSLHCCLIIHINISFKIYFTVSANSA